MSTKLKNPVLSSGVDLDLMKRQRITLDVPLTTSQSLVLNKNVVVPAGKNPQLQNKKSYSFWSPSASKVGGVSAAAPLAYVSDIFQPAVGVYVLAAPKRSGKTVVAAAIAAWANDVGTSCSYISCFEPRSWLGKQGKFFDRAENFISDVKLSIPRISSPGARIVIYDSATLPMKAYAKNFDNQATFTGGSQPSDRGFLDELSKVASDLKCCFIIVLNSTLVPYVTDFEGAVEGLITLIDIQHFEVNDRTTISGREAVPIEIPFEYVNASLIANHYGEFKGSTNKVSGINTRAGMYAKTK